MIKVGVFFGGVSREREVSFAGGRTVYDNLDKSLFDAVPIFVDSKGSFIELEWQYVYRGTIRDFYPPAEFIPQTDQNFQIYCESLEQTEVEYHRMISKVGVKRSIEELSQQIDFAFLTLHGLYGEDGTLQGMLEWFNMPYSGSGVLASALGVSKKIQKKWWTDTIKLNPWDSISLGKFEHTDSAILFNELKAKLGLPFVAKSSNQGSSIGVQVVTENNIEEFNRKVYSAFFIQYLTKEDYQSKDQYKFVQQLTDLRSGLGLPIFINGKEVHHPGEVVSVLNKLFEKTDKVRLQASNGEYEVVFEPFLKGREFSCIVIVDDQGEALALPPTEVVKGSEIFDYNSKYLPGLSHKQTPISIADEKIHEIRKACVELFNYFEFEVYARIDGFITEDGVFLNDPNTTSGMMPSSFFFHQAAEIGLNPKNFISYIIRTSIAERLRKRPGNISYKALLNLLDYAIENRQLVQEKKSKIAVLLGGYSTERHISVESGRNIYEKLASSTKYEPVPIFLSGSDHDHHLHEIPINIMLKDNADDIKLNIEKAEIPKALVDIRTEAKKLTEKYTGGNYTFTPRALTYNDLANEFDAVFIALHGRPGEDGQVQSHLDQLGLPYNGSGVESSQLTINKYDTNGILRANGFLVAESILISKDDWLGNESDVINRIEELGYPLICKPHDEGCSSAVIKIDSRAMLINYAQLCFSIVERNSEIEQNLGIGSKDEFPSKDYFMAESFTQKGDADRFLEITGGLVSHYEEGKLRYEVFEPSEALSTGTVLTLAEKFLAGEGQNITPARFSKNEIEQASISSAIKEIFRGVAKAVNVEGYCRIDAFVRIYNDKEPEVVIIEINSLPGMTPATCIYHQAAINDYKPFEFIDSILRFAMERKQQSVLK